MMQTRTTTAMQKAAKVAAVVRDDVKYAVGNINRDQFKYASVAAFMLTFASVATYAQEETPTIDFDLTPFFTSLNTYLPIFMALFAVIGGIAGAMALSRYIIGAIVRAFSGGSIS